MQTDNIEQKIDKLWQLWGQLVTEDGEQSKPFKPQVYQSNRGRRQNRGSYQDRFRSNNAYMGHSAHNMNFRARTRYNVITEVVMVTMHEVIRGMAEIMVIIEGMVIEIKIMTGNRSRRLERQDRSRRNDRSVSNSRLRSGSRASTNRDRIRCFICREYDHFTRECPTRQESRETEEIQQMFNMDKDQTILQTPLIDAEEDKMTITLMEASDNLNLWGKDGSATFLPFCQKLGGNNNRIKNSRDSSRDGNCLMLQQTDFIYKEVELGSLINNKTIREELDPDIKLDQIDDNSEDKDP